MYAVDVHKTQQIETLGCYVVDHINFHAQFIKTVPKKYDDH